MPLYNVPQQSSHVHDLRRFERSYTLPKGRERPSIRNIEHHFRVTESMKNGGGLNEGINIVEHKQTGKRYIQKKLPADIKESEREILFLNVLRHPNIIEYIDACIPRAPYIESASLYIEFCELGTLQDLIEKYVHRNEQYPREQAYIPEPFIWHVLESMTSALVYIHHGILPDGMEVKVPRVWPQIVHRDIKPDNIFLRRSEHSGYPEIVLADFGCASRYEEPDFNDKQRYFIGTSQYSPPEADRQVARADIWSLGASILCLCWLFTDGPKQTPPRNFLDSHNWLKKALFKKCIYDSVSKYGNGLGRHYSEDLDWVVGRSTQWERENRPLAWELSDMIKEHKPRDSGKQGRGLPRWALERP